MSPSTPAVVSACHCGSSGRGRSGSGSNGGPGGRVEFLGWQTDEQIRELYRSSRATLLPGIEDFGIVPVESQACGTPVVALNAGGARETVIDGETGVLVDGTSVEAFAGGLERALSTTFDRTAVRRNAERFSRAKFITSFTAAVEQAIADKARGGNADAARWGARRRQSSPTPGRRAAEDERVTDALPAAGARADMGNEALDVAGRSSRGSSTGSPEPPLVDSDAARMSPASPRDSSGAPQSHRSSILMPQEGPHGRCEVAPAPRQSHRSSILTPQEGPRRQ